MAAPAQQPAFPRDAWPTFELKRLPNNEMGVLMEFPAPPELRQHFDVLALLIEPQRAKMMHQNLEDLLGVLGLVEPGGRV